jgi:putative ABC transport system permease protein
MLGAVTVLLLLIGLVAAAGFAVIAARRQRGMLAAIGATRKQLRMVMVTGGAVVGVIAAVAGTAAGLAVWIAAAPGLDTFAGHGSTGSPSHGTWSHSACCSPARWR